MLKNSSISLNTDSLERNDIVNTIKYTLLMDYDAPKLDEEPTFVERLMQECYQCCIKHFFSNDFILGYNFFGLPSPSYSASPLNTLNDGKFHESACFQTMLLHHCIFSSYHAILTELLGNSVVSSGDVAVKIKTKGIHSLYKNQKLILKQAKGFHYFVFKDSQNSIPSKASDFMKKTEHHIHKLPAILQPMVNKTDGCKNAYQYTLQFSNLFFHICKINAASFNIINKADKNRLMTKTLLAKINSLTESMEPAPSFDRIPERIFHTPDITDALYHYYLTERIFNFRLFFGLLQNIRRIEEETSYRLCQEQTLRVLTCCKKLPNIFTRQYFLKYAFDQIIYTPESYRDYWSANDFSKAEIIVSDARRTSAGFQFTKWLEQYELFINYMADFVIPLYEGCFISMLLESVEKEYPHEEYPFHLIKAMELLASYMETHYQEILQPIDLKSDMEFVDVVSPLKSVASLECLPIEAVLQVKNELLSPDPNLELNLKLLNPAFFKKEAPSAATSNFRRVQKFYIDLIRYTYLEKKQPKNWA